MSETPPTVAAEVYSSDGERRTERTKKKRKKKAFNVNRCCRLFTQLCRDLPICPRMHVGICVTKSIPSMHDPGLVDPSPPDHPQPEAVLIIALQVHSHLERFPRSLGAVPWPEDQLVGAAQTTVARGHNGLVVGLVGLQVAVGRAGRQVRARGAGEVAARTYCVGSVVTGGAAVEGVVVGRNECACRSKKDGSEKLHDGCLYVAIKQCWWWWWW